MDAKKSLPKFIIIGSATENTRDLLQEIEKRGLENRLIPLRDISFEFSGGTFSAHDNNTNLENFDIFIFRGYNKNLIFAQVLAKNLLSQNKIVLDETLGKNYISGKIHEATVFLEKNIPHPKTYQAIKKDAYKKIISEISFPIIVKPVDGQKGQDIEKFNDQKSALDFFNKNPKGFFIQEYLSITDDIRVFVVAGKVLGAIKRLVIPGDHRSNASLGAKTEKIELTEEMRSLALKASQAMGYEIAGVDLVENNGDLYVLEVNIAPQWQKFKETTGINPAEHIINYALEKYEKN